MRDHRFSWLLLAVLLGLHGLLGAFPQIMTGMGVGRSGIWFRDTHSMLAASDAAGEGLDPFVNNPHDLGKERHIYPDWWFALGWAGLTRADTFWLGWVVVGLFWLAVLAVVPLRAPRDLGWTLLICASPPFWLAVNRANPDLLVFALLTPVVPMLLQRNKWIRLLAPGPVALATGLKFFPVLAGAVFLQPAASRRENGLRWVIIAGLGLLLAWSLEDDVARYVTAGWLGRGLFTFGAAAAALHCGGDPDFWVNAGRLAGLLLVAWGVWRGASGEKLDPRPERDERFHLMGTAVLAGLFFLTVGYLYKIIFVVWLLPGLLAGAGMPGVPGRRARWALGCLAGLVWIEGLGCAVLSSWPHLADAPTQVMIRRTAATLSGLLAWGFLAPLAVGFGVRLRVYWQQWRESTARPATGGAIH
jgi:hypothetical protein